MQVLGPEEMILVPPRHYCIIKNPVERDADGNIVLNDDKQVWSLNILMQHHCEFPHGCLHLMFAIVPVLATWLTLRESFP